MRVFSTHWPSSMVIEIGPDTMLTPARDREFHYTRTKTGLSIPHLPKKNEAHLGNSRGGRRLAPAHVTLRQLISNHCFSLETCLLPMSLTLEMTYGRKRDIAGLTYPNMDSDACLSAVRDALECPTAKGRQYAHPRYKGLVLDDGQIIANRCIGRYVQGQWGLRIELNVARLEG